VCLVTALTKNRNVECENMALVSVCVCVVTAVTKNRKVECEKMALLCVCAWLLQRRKIER